MLNLNRFSIFFKWKVFDFFVIEEIKTCTIDACHKSVFKLTYSQASTYSGFKYNWSNAPYYLKSWILRSLPNTKLLNRSQGFCSCSEQLLLVISNGSCQYYFLLLDILVVPSCINYILLRKDICPKCFSFYQFLKDDITKNKNMWHATPPILKLAAISPESSRESMTVSKASPSFEIFLDFLLSRKNIYILLFFIFSSYKLN